MRNPFVIRRSAAATVGWFLLTAMVAACAPAQESLGEGEIETSLAATSPIEFEPTPPPAPSIPVPYPEVTWSLSDFTTPTGRVLTPDTIITLEDGTERRADRAIELLNRAEDEVNLASSTLAGGPETFGTEVELPGTGGITATKIPAVYTLVVDTSALEQQKEDFIDTYDPKPLERMPSVDEFIDTWEPEGGDGDGTDGSVPGVLIDPEPCEDKNESVSDQWSDGWGDKKVFWVGLHANVALAGTPEAATFEAGAGAEGKLFGAGFDLVAAEGSFVGPASGSGTGSARVTVLDKDLFNGNTPVGEIHEGDYHSSFNTSVSIPVATLLGLVTITAKVGVKGQAGGKFKGVTRKLKARGHVTPYVNATGYAKAFAAATIDLGIAKGKLTVGVGGDLTFLDDRLVVRGNIHQSTSECVQFDWKYKAKNAMRALAGKLYVFAKAKGCLLGACVSEHWRFNLFKWAGLGPYETVLFQGSN